MSGTPRGHLLVSPSPSLLVFPTRTLNPEPSHVIELTRLNGEPFVLNAELIQYVETLPDTYITLTSGERLVVQESMDEVVARAVEYQRSKWLVPPPAPPRAW